MIHTVREREERENVVQMKRERVPGMALDTSELEKERIQTNDRERERREEKACEEEREKEREKEAKESFERMRIL